MTHFTEHSPISLAEINLFFQGFAVSFATLATLVGIGIVALCITASVGIRWALPESDLKLELKLFLHVLQIITACLLTIRFDAQTLKLDKQVIDYKPFALLILLLLMLGTLGYGWYQLKLKKKKWTF